MFSKKEHYSNKKKKIFIINLSLITIIFIFFIPLINASNVNNVQNLKIDNLNKIQDINYWKMITKVKFIHAFVASLSVIIVSELGDKTFFIAAILAMKNNRWTVFLGAISALFFMTLLSSFLGLAANIIPKIYINLISIFLFFIFGVKMIYDSIKMSKEESEEEFEEIQKTFAKKENTNIEINTSKNFDVEIGISKNTRRNFSTKIKRKFMQFVSLIFIETFTMTFLAEWGDRSQIATVILSAREDVIGVTLGAFFGHSFCTGLAVLGGRLIAKLISVKTVTLVGGFIFLTFSIYAFIIGVK